MKRIFFLFFINMSITRLRRNESEAYKHWLAILFVLLDNFNHNNRFVNRKMLIMEKGEQWPKRLKENLQ